MGERVTHRAKSAEITRAKALKDALDRGVPGFVPPVNPGQPGSAPDPVEVQKAYLEQLLECTPEALSILDSRVVVRINTEFTRVFGFTPEQTVGRTIDSLIVPPDRGSETRWIGEMLARGEKVAFETKRQRKDGTLVDVFISATPVLVAGKKVGAYVLYRDISEQKRAESLNSALYRIAQKTGSAVDLPNFYAAIHNIVGELMYAHNFYIALFDSATQSLSFPYFVDEQDPAPVRKRMGRGLTEYVLRSGEPLLCTPQVFDQMVERGEVELIGAPSLDWLGVPLKSGSEILGVVVVQSYTESIRFSEKDKEILTFVSQQLASAIEHKHHEEELRRSEARYRSLVQSAVYGMYRCSQDGKFLDVNPALVCMLGYESGEQLLALDPKCDVFNDPADLALLLREFKRGSRLDNLEVRWKRKEGKTITVRISGRSVASAEQSDDVLELMAEDVTERHVLENQLRQSQKMEAVGRLAGGVAHDFNNLLMVISGYTEVLLGSTDPANPLRSKIEAIQQAADRAGSLTRQLLAFSRKQLLELKVVDINSIVADMERLLRPLIGENIELVTRLASDLGRTRADAGQIEQVIMNLVVNSKDAMPSGGKITITTSNARLNDDPSREYNYMKPGAYILLTVSDTGHGMDKETQARIFEPFFTTKEKGKGTGLGLSTVYGIVKQSGGYIFAQSESGHGTNFRIYLPQVDDVVASTGNVRSPLPDTGGSETVLLVEDEESVRQLVRETLEGKGYRVLEADNGETALELARRHQGGLDLLITDVVMPGMSGRELAVQLCTSHAATKVLYLSGYTEDAIVHQGVLDPGTAFLQKPFTLQTLSRKVREVLRAGKD